MAVTVEIVPRAELEHAASDEYQRVRRLSERVAAEVNAGTCSVEIRDAFQAGVFEASRQLWPKVRIAENRAAADRLRERERRRAKGFNEHPMALMPWTLVSEIRREERDGRTKTAQPITAHTAAQRVAARHGISERELYRRVKGWLHLKGLLPMAVDKPAKPAAE
jgi:hypothetical protein